MTDKANVKVVLHGNFTYEAIMEEDNNGIRKFFLPSGDGYSSNEIQEVMEFITDLTGSKFVSLYATDYDEIPFDEIYATMNDGLSPTQYHHEKPTRKKFNSYDHGFFLVLAS